ncbi:hypothetical protein MHU86_19491 [Fragilaria crotonensis]|nr:hypothetical protein MHU86_19491 [Fragilaria crotonensis]
MSKAVRVPLVARFLSSQQREREPAKSDYHQMLTATATRMKFLAPMLSRGLARWRLPINHVWDPTERMHDSPLFVDEPQSEDVLQTEPDSIDETEIPHVSCDLIEAPDIKPRRSRRWLILILFALIAIGAIGGVIGYLLTRKTGTSGSSATSTSEDDDEDCQSTQDPFRQCECFGQIQVTDTNISDEYYSLTTSSELTEFVGLGISIESCSPENVALAWLATEMAAANEASQAVIDKKVLDRLVMAHVFETLGGRDWTERTKWMSSSSVCDWFGISCDGDGNIVMLSLPKNQLQGSLDSRLGLLQNLTTLQLSENDITGSIPLDVWSLPSLENLLLNSNKLSGVISMPSIDAPTLTKIDLALNMFTGSLPSFTKFAKLQHLNVSHMTLTGTLPTDINLLPQLESFDLTGNQDIDGTIPSGLKLLSNLTYFAISDTIVSGSVSELVELLPDGIEYLSVAFTFIGDSIPTSIGRLSKLEHLDLAFLPSEGSIPSELGLCTQLQFLNLAGSFLTGTLPSELGNLSELRTLILYGNQEMSGTVPPEYAKLSKLETFNIDLTKISS